MKANQYQERVYELLELFDFEELSDEDRIYVLSNMPEEEYLNLRYTLKVTETFFSNSKEPNINNLLFNSIMQTNYKPNILIKILNQPVKFYQLAASILLLLGLYAIKQYSDLPDKNSAIQKNDTIYIQKTDTVSSLLADTVKNIKEKVIYVTRERDSKEKLLSNTTFESYSCKNEVHDNIERIKQLSFFTYNSSETLFKN
jgi:hypothetical protein